MKNQAFTLIELFVVVLIIGILSAIALPQYQAAVDKARASEAFIFAKHIKDLQEVYYLANGHYAANCEELGADLPAGFAEDPEDAGLYILTKGDTNSLLVKCANSNGKRVMVAVESGSLSFVIEIYFDHIAENAGKAFCRGSGGSTRALRVCKSLSNNARDGSSWWL